MKNKFLLLGATALLSTGALVAKAEFQKPELEIKAQARFVKSVTVNSDPIEFGVIDPSAGGYVTIDKDTGEATGTAKIITNASIHRGFIDVDGYEDLTSNLGGLDPNDGIDLVLDGKTFPLYEEEATQDEIHRCGTVRDLERTIIDDSDIAFYVGGTLDVNANYTPPVSGTVCSGSTTVTYILKEVP